MLRGMSDAAVGSVLVSLSDIVARAQALVTVYGKKMPPDVASELVQMAEMATAARSKLIRAEVAR